jgi:hypothetical protein
MSSDIIAINLQKKWGVSLMWAKAAALIIQGKREEAMNILDTPEHPNAEWWIKLAQEKAVNDNIDPITNTAEFPPVDKAA